MYYFRNRYVFSTLSSFDLENDHSLQACNNYSRLGLAEKPTLFFEFHCSQQGMEHQTEVAKEIAGYNEGSDFAWAIQQEDRSRLWAAR